jgi:hypothetical protein
MKQFLVLMLLSPFVHAQSYFCTEWTLLSSYSCVFAGRSSALWARQCENVCQFRDYGPHCDLDRIWSLDDPNKLSRPCSKWVKEFGMSCSNPNTGRFEQKWVRVCQIGLATTWCSDQDPNQNSSDF